MGSLSCYPALIVLIPNVTGISTRTFSCCHGFSVCTLLSGLSTHIVHHPKIKETGEKVAPPDTVIRTRTPSIQSRAGLHDHVPADLLSRWQKVCQSRATQLRCTGIPDWVTTSACNPPFGIVTVVILNAMVASWHPIGAALVEGQSGTLSFNPAQSLNHTTTMPSLISIHSSLCKHANHITLTVIQNNQ